MTLPASGAISISQLSTELGRSSTATTSLGETATRSLAGVSSGAISFSQLYGKSVGPAGPTFSPTAGTYTVAADGTCTFTITCSTTATWTWTRSGTGTASIATGGTGTSITFTVTAPLADRTATFTVTGTAGGVTRNYTITMTAYSGGSSTL